MEKEPVGRGRNSGTGPVFRFQYDGNLVGVEAAPAAPDEGSDHVPGHEAEDAAGLPANCTEVAAAGHLEPAESADRVLCAAPGGAE